ncbi:DUF4249 domain-containing protein [Pontibacter vulgaris]|uniref:DUF4249 domain-containing protein n=1 Tax=Pontibacter vulgaris TaxID=2905679 RepID=UPI001FA7D418|nr:DUF4249 domain-containing protein [Pontibacter vulgaris]
MKLNYKLYLLLLPFLFFLVSCDLEKDIEVELPYHEPQLVVECYLEPGKPLRATILESSAYFDDPQPPLVPDAEVFISHNGRRTKLSFKPFFDREARKLYTHQHAELVTGKPGDIYSIEVIDGKGRKATGFTTILPTVPIDTVEWKFNDNEKAYLLTTFQDDANSRNFYRYMVHRDSLNTDSDRDFITDDDLTNGKRTSYGSAYDYEKGDTLIITFFHIEKPYYDFLQSTSDAKNANGNPFSQPSKIKSTVQGGFGVFTNLAYDRKVVVIK